MITAVIVTYNSEKDISRCLRGLFSQGIDVSCVLIDNASQDGTLDMLQEFSGYDLMVIQNEENLGFSKAVNQGIHQFSAIGSEAQARRELSNFQNLENNEEEYILLLNPDAEMEQGALRTMLQTMESHEKAAVVQPLLTLMRKPDRVNTAGNRYRGFGLVTVGGFGESVESFSEDRQIEYASGACMLVRADVFQQLGGLDESFFLYFEDTDFSRRVRKAGYDIWLSAQARVRHDHFFPFRFAKAWNFVKSWGVFLKGS